MPKSEEIRTIHVHRTNDKRFYQILIKEVGAPNKIEELGVLNESVAKACLDHMVDKYKEAGKAVTLKLELILEVDEVCLVETIPMKEVIPEQAM